jgi:hypothetical protein
MSEWLDEDGYPTEAALERLEKWDILDSAGALDFAKELWCYPDRVWDEERLHGYKENTTETIRCFSTGGWSGNESVIRALNENFGVMIEWVLSKRGGRHEYVYNPEKYKNE